MTRLRRLLSLNLIITAGPILMLALLSLVLGVDRYRSEYDRTFDHTVQMARVAAQPIVSLVSTAMAGGNYAALQEDAAVALLTANSRMRLLVVEGRTSVKDEPFGIVFDRASSKVYRTTWSAAEVADLRKKVARARQALDGMEPGSPRYDQLTQRLGLWEDLVRRSVEDVAAAQRLTGAVERPRQTPSISGVDYDRESELLHLTLRTDGVQGSVWMVLDGAHLANVGNEVLKGVLPINIAGLFVVAGLSLLLSRLVVGPLHGMTRTMRAMAEGNYPDTVPNAHRQDEIGDMARALEVFKGNAETVDLLVRRITDDARHVSASAGQASAATTQVSAGARNQLEAVQQVAAALSQSADAITDVARSAQTASDQSRESSQLVGSGAERIAGMVDVVRAMADDSARIGKIVSDISLIADQTNMLALNTAIEAAHAGEHGQGFSVVADEVRKLSENTHALAQSIGEIIAEASERATSGLDMAEEIASSVQRIGEIVQRNERLVSAIAAAVEQQQTAVGDIKHSVEELDRIGQANASASEEIATTMHKLADLSGETTRQVESMSKKTG